MRRRRGRHSDKVQAVVSELPTQAVAAARRVLRDFVPLDPAAPVPALSWGEAAVMTNRLYEAAMVLDEELKSRPRC
jgi:hypothetical protein